MEPCTPEKYYIVSCLILKSLTQTLSQDLTLPHITQDPWEYTNLLTRIKISHHLFYHATKLCATNKKDKYTSPIVNKTKTTCAVTMLPSTYQVPRKITIKLYTIIEMRYL